MGKLCKFCGEVFEDPKILFQHEYHHRLQFIHRELDILNGHTEEEPWPAWESQIPDSTQSFRSNREVSRGDNTHTQESRQAHTSRGIANQCTEQANRAMADIQSENKSFTCEDCGKTYSCKSSLQRHLRLEHDTKQFACDKCKKRFTRDDYKRKHEVRCQGLEHICPLCQKRCATAHGLRRHLQWHDKQPCKSANGSKHVQPKQSAHNSTSAEPTQPRRKPTQFRCRRCTEVYTTKHELHTHHLREHYQQTGGALQPRPWGPNEIPPWAQDAALQNMYEDNAPLILENHLRGRMSSVYNFPVTNEVDVHQLMRFAETIYREQHRAFRLNVVFGTILQHRETGRYRYFVAYNNNGIFERPLYISRHSDLQRLRRGLEQKDIFRELLRQRPDTKWIPVLVTNVHFVVYETNYPLGQGPLPEYLMTKDSLYPLVKNQQNGKPYQDQLCAFRCLALHRGHEIRCIEGAAKELYRQWTDQPIQAFEGLSLDELPEFENRFDVNVEVYSLKEDGFAWSVYRSRGQHDTTMNVNLFENHLSYIRNFDQYAKKYQCKTCDRHFDRVSNLKQHQNNCSNKTKFVYPGGFYRANESIFEKLEQYDIHVPENERTFPWYICYDFEALLQKVHDRPTDRLQWTHKHVPISVSICSNVVGHEMPVCIVEADEDRLVAQMVTLLNRIAQEVYDLAEAKWNWILEAIDRKINEDGVLEEEPLKSDNSSGDELDAEAVEDEAKKPSHPLQKLYGQLEAYMYQVPVLGFNSAKYDLNLVKRCLAKHLNMHEESRAFVVKKNNAYTCMSTESLKFLDMSQFLAAGSSYAGFLKAYRVDTKKGFFPYEWLDNITKLESTSLPPHEAFYSRLKGENISEEEYQYCQQVWTDHGMTTFRDFLVWYNNLDVQPFVEAIDSFQKFYFEKGVDVFKTAISVPGIARQLLFKTARKQKANFALFDKNNQALYETVKSNIVGGPSIIFTRHHCAKHTRIRGKKSCGSILGFDANALYLQAIGQPMPVGPFVLRRADNDFRPELRDKYMAAYYWMEWLAHRHNLAIQHKLNSGREVKIGKYPVDGYLPPSKPGDKATVFQFQGCFFHGHRCEVTKGVKDDKWLSTRARKYAKTRETTAYLSREHNVIEIWECEFRQYCRETRGIYDFIDGMRPGFFRSHKGKITEDVILEAVHKDELFGMVEVDIKVPDEWPSYFRHPHFTPYQYFEEMSPLFCTTDIPFDAIGEHMQAHVVEHHLSDKPRRLLVGGMKARQILLATPLLRWYLKHGLIVSKIYQVIEYQAQRCFREFVAEVSDARRQGDLDPDTSIIADTMKVIGNSGYGSLIMDKTKHRDVKYVQGENETALKVNDPLFTKLECLDEREQYYEVEMAKRKIKLDLPIQLGYYILQYAKLRMLEFYFDFMDKYVDRSDFEYLEMDTDSAYMAISGSCLEDVIRPEMQAQYQHGLRGFCIDSDIEADATNHWFPRTCCVKHAKHDKRTPGLFKLEYQGDEMIGLCSKTYIVRKTKVVRPSSALVTARKLINKAKGKTSTLKRLQPRYTHEYKFSSKGISKRHLRAPMTKFRQVLKTRKAQGGLNRGFRVRNNAVFTYTQERRGFSYLYCKRKVLDDGIHTVPLDITLCPLPLSKRDVDDQELVDVLASLLAENE